MVSIGSSDSVAGGAVVGVALPDKRMAELGHDPRNSD